MRGQGAGERFAWVDYAKGICLVAVVGLYAATYVEKSAGDAGWMQHWVDFARPFRMPDFFLIAGLFLGRTIDRPWRQYLDRKVVHFAYFMILWTTVYFVLRQGLIDDSPPGGTLWREYLWWYAEPFHMLWFIEMLPVYFLVTRLLRRVPWAIVLTLAALLQVWELDTGWRQLDRFGERFVYFYAGYALAPLAFRLAAWARAHVRPALVALIGWAAVMVVGSLLSAWRFMDWLRYLGQHSIVVFLSFFPVTLVASRALGRIDLIDDTGTQVLLVTAASVALPVLFHRLVRGTPARYLFERPRWARLATAPRGAPLQAGATTAPLPAASPAKT